MCCTVIWRVQLSCQFDTWSDDVKNIIHQCCTFQKCCTIRWEIVPKSETWRHSGGAHMFPNFMSVWQLKETHEPLSVQPFLVLHHKNSAATSEIWQRQIVYHDVCLVFGKIGLATLISHFLHFLSLKSNPNVCVSNKSWPFSWRVLILVWCVES